MIRRKKKKQKDSDKGVINKEEKLKILLIFYNIIYSSIDI